MKKVLIIGDGCSDVFRYGICDRLSPEAPVPIFLPTRTTGNGGMAINVFENLKALGIDCDIITNDIRPVKTRYVDEVSNQILLRVDEADTIRPITADTLQKIDFSKYDAVVISDYDKGFLSESDVIYISNRHKLIFMDTKKDLSGWALGVKFIKINQKEFERNQEWLLNSYVNNNVGHLIATNGKDGAILDFAERFPITKEHEVRDLSGAGDTFLAGLVASYIKNDDICEAIEFANRCAAWVVSQKGVAIINPVKI